MKNFLKFKKRKKAFSLVEIMVSLIAVSVLLAVFVPVITKKVKPKINIGSGSSNITSNCSEKFSSDCILCDGTKKCYVCNKICTSGKTKNSDTCTCESCSETNSCTECPDGEYLESGSCVPCPAGFYCTNGTKTRCEEGYYCVNGTRTPCDPGKWSSTGSTSCTQNCSAGYACKDGVKTQCTTGTYSLAGASSCSSCESKTLNCATCDSKTGACSGCGSGLEWNGSSCVSACVMHLLYSYVSVRDESCDYGWRTTYSDGTVSCSPTLNLYYTFKDDCIAICGGSELDLCYEHSTPMTTWHNGVEDWVACYCDN